MTASCRVAVPSTAVHAVQHSALPIGADDDEDDATLFVKHLELANWAELVDGTADRDMLLYFFAPWCGHCRSERACRCLICATASRGHCRTVLQRGGYLEVLWVTEWVLTALPQLPVRPCAQLRFPCRADMRMFTLATETA